MLSGPELILHELDALYILASVMDYSHEVAMWEVTRSRSVASRIRVSPKQTSSLIHLNRPYCCGASMWPMARVYHASDV
jgi:hypothetical protein